MTDLAHLDNLVEGQDRGAELVIKHPVTGELIPDVVLIVAGPDSDVQRLARLKYQDAFLAFRAKPPADELDRMEIDRLARCVVGWRMKRDGEDVPFSFSGVVRLLTTFNFIREQLEAFANSRVPYFLRTPFEDQE